MDPCPFVRVMVGNLALAIPMASKSAPENLHPSTTSCFCKIKLNNRPYQTSTVPLVVDPPTTTPPAPSDKISLTLAACFSLSKSDVEKVAGKAQYYSMFVLRKKKQKKCKKGRMVVKVVVYIGMVGARRLVGKVRVPVDLTEGVEGGGRVHHDGWISLGKEEEYGIEKMPAAKVYVTVMSEPDPRFVFEFDGEPECSPQVFQVKSKMRQPMFTCKFSLRNVDKIRTQSWTRSGSKKWLASLGSQKERSQQHIGMNSRERKGWSVTVHDLSGSAVAFASIVTPFVASPAAGSPDHVDRSSPGAWLILRPGDGGTWRSWGRLEAWRTGDDMGVRFEVVVDDNNNNNFADGGGSSGNVFVAETTINSRAGGKFCVDLTGNKDNINDRTRTLLASPACGPKMGVGSFRRLHNRHGYRGFVMSSTVQGEGKCSKPVVEIGVQNVGCAEDAAAFVALAAVVDLSMDACMPLSHKLRKELTLHAHLGAASST